MRKSSSKSEITSSLIRSRCKQVASAPRRYEMERRVVSCEQYFALLHLFKRLDPERDHDLLAGALAAYGWMPTMMKNISKREQLKSLIAQLRKSRANNAADVLSLHRGSGALRAVNNSTIGTSKLLHFFLPDRIAIWDSVLGRSFNLVHGYQIDSEDRFINYTRAIHEAAGAMDARWSSLKLANGDGSFRAGRIRQIEYTLYVYGSRHSAMRSVTKNRW